MRLLPLIALALTVILGAAGCPEDDEPAGTPDAATNECANVGCGPAPICGEACQSSCGCCPCGGPIERDGVTYSCSSEGCYVAEVVTPTTCSSSIDCHEGWACCYPCGIEGCEFQCEPACDPSEPGCNDGCVARP